MTLETWLLFCVTETVLCFSPGPAVLLVISQALTKGFRGGFAASFGILAANTGYFAVSATGLGAVLLASWKLFFVIKWLGAAYLIWLGVWMLVSRVDSGSTAPERLPPVGSGAGSFWRGFVTQAANPKALVFFTALLPQFIDSRGAVAFQVVVLGVSSVIIELIVLSIYVTACHAAGKWAQDPRLATYLQRVGGVLLIGAGARLAAIRHA